jgi:5'-3' exonuclease
VYKRQTAGKDTENGKRVFFNDKEVIINSAIYGYEIIMNMLVSLLKETGHQPIDTLLVFEGKSSKSKRTALDSSYKGGGQVSKPPEAYLEFQALSDKMRKVWKDVGATCLTQDFAEGDDTLAWLAREWPGRLTVATYDNDLSALNSEPGETNAYGGTCQVWVGGNIGLNKYGAFDYRRIRIYKALVGDPSDKIKGVAGFGPAAFDSLVTEAGWDGIDELEEMLEAGDLGPLEALAEENTTLSKLAKKIVASADSALKAWRVVKLYPEWVNTFKHPIQIVAGKVTSKPDERDERLEDWYGQDFLVTASQYQDALETLADEIPRSPFVAFDIETSTPEESDEWLAAQGDPDGVDVIASTLTGFSLTFGRNMQYTLYVSVDHALTNNVSMKQAREMLELVFSFGKSNVIHNTYFEIPVLYGAQDEDGTLWRDLWADNGFKGCIPNALDTRLEASYTDENLRMGLKLRSKMHLGYEQSSYDSTTSLSGVKDSLPAGGRLVKEWDEVTVSEGGCETKVTKQTRRYKMRELPASHVTAYALDDTICTAALHVYFHLVMNLEHSWQAYLDSEIEVAYLNALSFYQGMEVSIQKSKELEKIDDVTYSKSWDTVRDYLLKNKWEGTQPPTYTQAITVKEIKQAYAIVTKQLDAIGDDGEQEDGEEPSPLVQDPVLKTKVRTPSKLVALLQAEGHAVFATMLYRCIHYADAEDFTNYVRSHFTGEPVWKFGNKNMSHLLYTVMGCPVKIRAKATDLMRSKGIYEGKPKADAVAISYALVDMRADAEICSVLRALRLMQMVQTRRSNLYTKWPNFVHWRTGRIHASHMQASTVTRRDSESKPNRQQIGKAEKIEGEPQRYREVMVPHKPRAVIVSVDLSGQELRHICNYSHDPAMKMCFIGDHKRDMHLMTGVSILQLREPKFGWTYEMAESIMQDPEHSLYKKVKKARSSGKTTNFAGAYGAMAKTLSIAMMSSEEDAQLSIDAQEAAFSEAAKWKIKAAKQAEKDGFVVDPVGGRRHLREAMLGDKWEKQRAARQATNYLVQGVSAHQTKRAACQMWRDELFFKYDAQYIQSTHDEHVASVSFEDAVEFIKEFHACMVRPFPGMWVPIESDISIGWNYGELHELGKVASKEIIEEGLTQLQKLS